jgi:hypothetical protein
MRGGGLGQAPPVTDFGGAVAGGAARVRDSLAPARRRRFVGRSAELELYGSRSGTPR